MKLVLKGPAHRVARLNKALNTYDWEFEMQVSDMQEALAALKTLSIESQATDLGAPECGGFMQGQLYSSGAYYLCRNQRCAIWDYCPLSEGFNS